ncbi:hypothetical protein ADUPG1_007697 [Aduncisulcus paluster]|uniref:Uncharacterized protein n=1 Tax=Aduncisulcus paluster TaxID=2918883 RepID=A0ABQ5KP86_9EUKA|nr:hypothetical protein ADUPG1_007697 [Aduncisulcus paluster]
MDPGDGFSLLDDGDDNVSDILDEMDGSDVDKIVNDKLADIHKAEEEDFFDNLDEDAPIPVDKSIITISSKIEEVEVTEKPAVLEPIQSPPAPGIAEKKGETKAPAIFIPTQSESFPSTDRFSTLLESLDECDTQGFSSILPQLFDLLIERPYELISNISSKSIITHICSVISRLCPIAQITSETNGYCASLPYSDASNPLIKANFEVVSYPWMSTVESFVIFLIDLLFFHELSEHETQTSSSINTFVREEITKQLKDNTEIMHVLSCFLCVSAPSHTLSMCLQLCELILSDAHSGLDTRVFQTHDLSHNPSLGKQQKTMMVMLSHLAFLLTRCLRIMISSPQGPVQSVFLNCLSLISFIAHLHKDTHSVESISQISNSISGIITILSRKLPLFSIKVPMVGLDQGYPSCMHLIVGIMCLFIEYAPQISINPFGGEGIVAILIQCRGLVLKEIHSTDVPTQPLKEEQDKHTDVISGPSDFGLLGQIPIEAKPSPSPSSPISRMTEDDHSVINLAYSLLRCLQSSLSPPGGCLNAFVGNVGDGHRTMLRHAMSVEYDLHQLLQTSPYLSPSTTQHPHASNALFPTPSAHDPTAVSPSSVQYSTLTGSPSAVNRDITDLSTLSIVQAVLLLVFCFPDLPSEYEDKAPTSSYPEILSNIRDISLELVCSCCYAPRTPEKGATDCQQSVISLISNYRPSVSTSPQHVSQSSAHHSSVSKMPPFLHKLLSLSMSKSVTLSRFSSLLLSLLLACEVGFGQWFCVGLNGLAVSTRSLSSKLKMFSIAYSLGLWSKKVLDCLKDEESSAPPSTLSELPKETNPQLHSKICVVSLMTLSALNCSNNIKFLCHTMVSHESFLHRLVNNIRFVCKLCSTSSSSPKILNHSSDNNSLRSLTCLCTLLCECMYSGAVRLEEEKERQNMKESSLSIAIVDVAKRVRRVCSTLGGYISIIQTHRALMHGQDIESDTSGIIVQEEKREEQTDGPIVDIVHVLNSNSKCFFLSLVRCSTILLAHYDTLIEDEPNYDEVIQSLSHVFWVKEHKERRKESSTDHLVIYNVCERHTSAIFTFYLVKIYQILSQLKFDEHSMLLSLMDHRVEKRKLVKQFKKLLNFAIQHSSEELVSDLLK